MGGTRGVRRRRDPRRGSCEALLHPGIRATGRVEGPGMGFSEALLRLLDAKVNIGPGILWREMNGNRFRLASAILGMRRKVAAWPIGIVGNILLFTVFLGGVFHTPQNLDLWGQAGRQIFFFIVSVYGWVRWYHFSKTSGAEEKVGVRPGWAGWRGRLVLAIGAVVLWTAS